ncbi:Chromosome partition protein Smc [Streptococcus infantarius subsp. infantarius]|nr:Chromosome partition protein Smc [Streptococcus infantarius subsp. infantarius]
MITFLDERDVEHGALATIKVTNAVNGERSLTGEIESGDYVLANIERGWRLRFEDEFYVVTYAKPVDDEKATHVTFDAIHQFFWDFDKSSVHEQLNDGSHTVLNYLDFIFADSGYTYTIDPLLKVYAFEKQSFGYKSRLNLFNDIITASGVEFQVNGKVVRILEKTGTDLSTVVRKNFNMNELGIEKHIGDFVTYQKGFGAWVDENDHTKGRLVTEYTSPLASVYGKLEAEPLVDERYTQADNMIAVLKANVDNSYSISVRLDMEDLTRAGYEYTQPRAGDYIMAINEILDFQEKIRIVSFTSEYDVTGQLIKHEVTCNDIGAVKKLSASYNLTKEQAQNASDSVGKAVEMANKALVSADGKSTVYFGNEFPKDEPKGTLHKGDSLYLTVGDTTKMYYWTGADWEELPIVNDVEAFKEQIADELKDVPNREEFEATITEKLATSKAEIKTQIDTAKTQAESNAKAYADEINQATAGVAEQANTAVNSLKSDLAKVKSDLTATTTTANAAKTSASEAKQQLTTVANDLSKAKTDLQNAVSAVDAKATNLQTDLAKAKQDLTSQASQLTEQANAQSELTKRVSTVEETANGTKTTVSELSKTVASNTNNITSVSNRTKTVEDDLTSTKTTLSQVQTTANSASQKTATLETGLNGLSARFSSLKIGGRNLLTKTNQGKTNWSWAISSGGATAENCDVDGINAVKLTRTSDSSVSWSYIQYQGLLRNLIEPNTQYTLSFDVKPSVNAYFTATLMQGDAQNRLTNSVGMGTALADVWTRISCVLTSVATLPESLVSQVVYLQGMPTGNGNWLIIKNIKLEKGNVATDYSPSDADIESKVAEYKQTADQNYASLQTTVQNLDGTVQQNKTVADQTAQGFSTRIESLETYKDGETTRASQYFESAKTETARQLTAERTAIAKDYVAKSTYTSDVTGIRNDLTATTTTANTTKTNLANYQASNDKVVANLQSNLQTANGNISSLQTKVEAVPGQITSAVSAVEGKIPTSAGGRNLALGTSSEWSDPYTYFNGETNTTINIAKVLTSGLKVGDTLKAHIEVKYENIVPAEGKTAEIWMQDSGNVTEWNNGGFLFSEAKTLSGSGEIVLEITDTINSDHLKNDYWNWGFRIDYVASGSVQFRLAKVEAGDLPTPWSPAPEDTVSQISSLSSQIKQTADGMTLLATKTEFNSAKTELQSGISTATSKADNAQSTANSNAQTISTHTTQISALNTGLSAKVSQTDFNSLSGRVTTAENNITAKANELSSKISSVESKIPTSSGGRNLALGTSADWSSGWTNFNGQNNQTNILYRIYNRGFKIGDKINVRIVLKYSNIVAAEGQTASGIAQCAGNVTNWGRGQLDSGSSFNFDGSSGEIELKGTTVVDEYMLENEYWNWQLRVDYVTSGKIQWKEAKAEVGDLQTPWSPAPEDYDSALVTAKSEIKQTTDAITASVSNVETKANTAQSTANTAVSKADAAQAGVNTLDSTTVKSASLTINTDGIVMKAGKSTTDVANAIGSYFAVNQNAINLFSDKINVKGSMIVDGAITSTKIASKTIDTAHLNGKIITADVISSNAITADAIKAGAVTTDKMTANSINGDRITAGTLDAAKIKAGSITASQIASGTITSAQIKTGTISAGNIATGAITTDKIAANSINSDKIVSSGITANVINGGKLQSLTNTTNFDLDTGKLFYNNNNTGVFRVEDGASTMGLKFSNTAITVNNTSRILSRVILGGDRRETTLDDGKWDQGGFTGIVAETINGVDSDQHAQADTLRVIGDNIYFTHSYNYDSLTSTSAQGWKMETFSPFSSYAGNVVLKPYGINYRQSDIITGDIRLDNGDGSGYWVRGCIRTLRNCFQHYLNGGTTSGAMNAIRDALKEISGV